MSTCTCSHTCIHYNCRIFTLNFNRFKGSLLFTHFGEIITPIGHGRQSLTREALNRLTTAVTEMEDYDNAPGQQQYTRYGSTEDPERETS